MYKVVIVSKNCVSPGASLAKVSQNNVPALQLQYFSNLFVFNSCCFYPQTYDFTGLKTNFTNDLYIFDKTILAIAYQKIQ